MNKEAQKEQCCYGGIAHDCHAGVGCRIAERLTATPQPPAQREWVGLTRMELIKCGVLPFGMSYELYQAIEAKLKEKNT